MKGFFEKQKDYGTNTSFEMLCQYCVEQEFLKSRIKDYQIATATCLF